MSIMGTWYISPMSNDACDYVLQIDSTNLILNTAVDTVYRYKINIGIEHIIVLASNEKFKYELLGDSLYIEGFPYCKGKKLFVREEKLNELFGTK